MVASIYPKRLGLAGYMTDRSFNPDNVERCADGVQHSQDPLLLNVWERSGDRSLGSTLIRLACLAEAAHRFECFDEIRIDHQRLGTSADWASLRQEVHGSCADTPQGQAQRMSGAVHTEVDR